MVRGCLWHCGILLAKCNITITSFVSLLLFYVTSLPLVFTYWASSWWIRFTLLESKICYPQLRVHNRFGGMRDLTNFCGDIRDGSWKQERDAGISITSGSGILCFQGVGMRESQGKSSGMPALFEFLRDWVILPGQTDTNVSFALWSVSAFKQWIGQGSVAWMSN